VERGDIGQPVAITGFMMSAGPEHGHPNPDFFYKRGSGPLFDMGPYYITAFIHLLGPIRRVTAAGAIPRKERHITAGPRKGEMIAVETPTHVQALLEFESGPHGQLTTTFDCWGSRLPNVELYGSEGTLAVPDPNWFGGPIEIRKAHSREWTHVPHEFPFTEDTRGLGVLDMAQAIRSGRPHRASAEIGYHVLDVMESILESADSCLPVEVRSSLEKPAPMNES